MKFEARNPKQALKNSLSFLPRNKVRDKLQQESRRRPCESREPETYKTGFLFSQETLDSRFHGNDWKRCFGFRIYQINYLLPICLGYEKWTS